MKLTLDEMWTPVIARELARRGFDVDAVLTRADLRGRGDDVIFAACRAEGRVVVTENVVDSRRLADETLRAGHGHPGVVFATSRRFPRADPRTTGRMIRALATLLAEKDDLENQEHFLQQASQSD